jgi:hypothetical protein
MPRTTPQEKAAVLRCKLERQRTLNHVGFAEPARTNAIQPTQPVAFEGVKRRWLVGRGGWPGQSLRAPVGETAPNLAPQRALSLAGNQAVQRLLQN